MNLSVLRFRAIFVKEYRHILRAPRTLLLICLAPAFLLALLANIFAIEAQQARFALWDLDNSTFSRRYVAALTADGDFTLEATFRDYEDIAPALRSGRVDFVLVIPHGFSQKLMIGEPAPVQAIFDATDSIRAPQLHGYLLARSGAFSRQVLLEGHEIGSALMELRSVRWYNPEVESIVYMVPGLTAIVLSMPALAYGLSLARERELGSFEGLITTPVHGAEYLFGKSLAYITVGLSSVLLTWLVGVAGYRVPFRGSFVLYMALAGLYLAATIGLVTAAAPILQTQQVAFFVVLAFFFIPSFFVSGLITPIVSTGLGRLSSDIFPVTHFIEIARGIFVKNLGIEALWRECAFLGAMYLVGMLVALATFRKRLM